VEHGHWVLQGLDARDAWILAIVALTFVTSRVVWLHLHLESSIYWEESYRWIAALEILKHPVMPFLDYQADNYQGGSLVMILLAASLFRIFGESIAVMKLSAVLVSTITLSLLYILGRRVFGRSTAFVAALAYVAGPPLVAYWGLVVLGSHGESVLFSLIQFLVFFEILSGHWRTAGGWALFGFVSGLGLWFCYTSALSLAACGITWVLLKGIPDAGEILSALAGGVFGLAPWLAYNATHQFVGIGRIGELFGYGTPVDAWVPASRLEKVANLVRRDLPVGLLLPVEGKWPRWVAVSLLMAFAVPITVAVGFALCRVVSLFLAGSAEHKRPGSQIEPEGHPVDLPFIVYGLVFIAFFLSSEFTIDPSQGPVSYRLLLPPTVIMMLPAAYTVSRALQSGSMVRSVAVLGCGLYLMASVAGTVLLASTPGRGTGLWLRFGQTTRGVLLSRKFERDVGAALVAARRVEDPQLHYSVLLGIGWGMEFRFEADGDLEWVQRELAAIPLTERFAVLAGLRFYAQVSRDALGSQKAGSVSGPQLAERLDRLQRFADDEWQRVPITYQSLDSIPSSNDPH
jgi:4-amino-4-deoxy-L-arabinose transferase-like glycosyltransferase